MLNVKIYNDVKAIERTVDKARPAFVVQMVPTLRNFWGERNLELKSKHCDKWQSIIIRL